MILLGDIQVLDLEHSEKHPLVQYFHKAVAGEISEESIHEVTQLILSFDFGTTLIEHQLHLVNGNYTIHLTF